MERTGASDGESGKPGAKKRVIAGVVAVLLVVAGLRVYGFYDSEKTSALNRANAADVAANKYKEEHERIRAQQGCNTAWTAYHSAEVEAQNARLDQQIAKLQGRPENRARAARAEIAAEASMPSCAGHEADLSEIMESLKDGLAAIAAEQVAESHAKAERAYAESRTLQTRYMGLRLWAFLTGTEPKKKPADLAFEQEQKHASATPVPQAEK